MPANNSTVHGPVHPAIAATAVEEHHLCHDGLAADILRRKAAASQTAAVNAHNVSMMLVTSKDLSTIVENTCSLEDLLTGQCADSQHVGSLIMHVQRKQGLLNSV